MPGGHHVEPQHDDGDGDKREGEVHEREQDLLHREHKAMDLDLLQERGRLDDGGERLARGIGHHGEGDVTHNEVERVHLRRDRAVATLGEDGGEHDGHHDHHEQRVEHAPGNAQEAAAVFDLEVFAH